MASQEPKQPSAAEAQRRARRFRIMRSIRVLALGGLWAIFGITMNLAVHWLGFGLVVILSGNAYFDYRDANK
jgi:hypothetical protein